jgi:hypothetical protein
MEHISEYLKYLGLRLVTGLIKGPIAARLDHVREDFAFSPLSSLSSVFSLS